MCGNNYFDSVSSQPSSEIGVGVVVAPDSGCISLFFLESYMVTPFPPPPPRGMTKTVIAHYHNYSYYRTPPPLRRGYVARLRDPVVLEVRGQLSRAKLEAYVASLCLQLQG